MVIDVELKNFLKENMLLLKQGAAGLSKLYEEAKTNFYRPGNLTKLLYESGIDVMGILGYVPDRFLYGLNQYVENNVFKIPEGTFYIGEEAFRDVQLEYNFENLNIPKSVAYIKHSAFKDSFLSQINLNEGLKTINAAAFVRTLIKEIKIPNSVTDLGTHSFYSCDELEKVVLGSGVKSLKQLQFEDCGNLKEVIYNGTIDHLSQIYSNAFMFCPKLKEIKCTDGIFEIK